MESLLPELGAMVAKYLSPRDLAACCAVSVHWRDIFGTNKVWKPLCVVEIEEYLRTTPCVVEPAFSVPLDQDSSLSPLSQWRLAFLREQHLWKNWREGNSKTVELYVTDMGEKTISLPYYFARFVTNDFVLIFKTCSVELWDVRTLDKDMVDRLFLDRVEDYFVDVFENGLVFLNNGWLSRKKRFLVLKVDVIEGTISVKYQFLFNKISLTPELVLYNGISRADIEDYVEDPFGIIIKKGRFCIDYFPRKAGNTFYVWDLETVAKLKRESFPNASLNNALIVIDSKTCDDVLMLASSAPLDNDSMDNVPLLCRVYDVQNLRFFTFSKCLTVNYNRIASLDIPVAITNNLVALTDCGTETRYSCIEKVKIFNYRTDQQLYSFEANHLVEVLGDECFLFTYDNNSATELVDWSLDMRICSVFCSSGDFVKDVTNKDATGLSVTDFRAIGNRFVEVLYSNETSEVWAINKFSMFKTSVKFPKTDESWRFDEGLTPVNGVNRACTKLIDCKKIYDDEDFESVNILVVSHFW